MTEKKRGSKLNKSDTVQVRFDPVLKMAAELAAGKERRSLSSLIEWAVEKAVKQVVIREDSEGNQINTWQIAQECWKCSGNGKIQMLADKYPELMTIRERKIFEAMQLAERVVSDEGEDPQILQAGMQIHGWGVFCQFADEQISLTELWKEIQNLRARFYRSEGVWVYAADRTP